MTIYVPFDFNPVSVVTLTTASYSIPANRYAFVSVSLDQNGSFLVSGTTVMVSKAQSGSAPSVIAVSQNLTNPYVVPSGYRFEGQVVTTAGPIGIAGAYLPNANDSRQGLRFGPGQAITGRSTETLTGVIIRENSIIEGAHAQNTFWLPASTSIQIVNGRAVVSLFEPVGI
jgi:hypothetical protein